MPSGKINGALSEAVTEVQIERHFRCCVVHKDSLIMLIAEPELCTYDEVLGETQLSADVQHTFIMLRDVLFVIADIIVNIRTIVGCRINIGIIEKASGSSAQPDVEIVALRTVRIKVQFESAAVDPVLQVGEC